jgi:hypothetical protein
MSKEEKRGKLLAFMIVEESVTSFWGSIKRQVDTRR